MNYIMPPRSKASDYAKGKITQNDIIALQIANDANIAKARKAVKMGEIEQLTPSQASSPEELLMDMANQEATARTNVMKLGFRDNEASRIITDIGIDPTMDYTILNANFPAIEADIKSRFNVKLLTPSFFIEYLKKYSADVAGAAGMVRVFNPNNAGFNANIDTIAELRAILPDPAVIEYLRQTAENSRIVGEMMLEQLAELRDMLPNAGAYQQFANQNPVQQQAIIDAYLARFENMPSGAEVRELAERVSRNDINNPEFLRRLRDIISSIPAGSGAGAAPMYAEAGSSSSSIASPSGVASQETEMRAIRDRIKQEKDRKAAQTAIDNNLDPRYLTRDQQTIYAQLTGIVRVAPTKEEMSSITGDTATTGESLGSAISLDTATLKQIKDTLRINPDIAGQLINLATGQRVNYNDLALNPPASSKSRKIGWRDTNLQELFQAKFGRGLIRKSIIQPKIRMKIGKGLAVKETPSYREYGKYAIHLPQLEQQDMLNVKYKSLGQIPKFKPIPVSDIFRDFILDLLENGKPNVRVYTQIAPEERKFFEEMSIGAGIWNSLGLKRTTTSNDEEENKRFELLKGEYIAGNNNTKLLSELRRLVVKMMSDGRIRKNQGIDLLMELSL
jgi:hypothetical protein